MYILANITIKVEVYIRSYNLKLRTVPALTRSVLEVTYMYTQVEQN